MSAFIDGIVAKAKELDKVIVLPETEDERVLKAAAIAVKEKIARVC
jgi:phosphotransacetylase